MSDTSPVVIVGGGVIGAACAHYLTEAGRKVVILERDRFGAACSHGNCGLLSPSHILPPAEPGVFGEALKSLFKPNAPLRLAPRFDPGLWRWMAEFARRCNEPAALAAGRAIHPLLASSRALYDRLAGGELECEFAADGLLFAFQSAGAFKSFGHTDELLSKHFNAPARRLDGAELSEFEPALRPGLAGGWFYEGDAHLRPNVLMNSWRASLLARGVELREGIAVKGFRTENGRATAVHYEDAHGAAGEIEADAVVVAAGALTPDFQKALGVRVPVAPGKGYSLTLHLDEHEIDPAAVPKRPMLLPEVRVAVTPHAGGVSASGERRPAALRLGSVMEFAGYNPSIARRRLALLTRGASRFLDIPADPPADDHPTGDNRWAGWRPMTPDGVPLIGPVPGGRGVGGRNGRANNLYVAAGHNMLGLSMAPGTGRLIAELVTGAAPHLDPAPYAPGRFSRG
ncbi:NAD(P)/FAD-dependent oxidoreductase [Alienimonas chondri]|uniref:D-amino acid dehydrogenase 1 n=1 Tax=Alienimonas chondri TaxID=2681879 RepID=A0ABX1VJY5_9PLAN|nr:FAD-dependent oxidoreductase [Alienimonas chondri]NNJ28057.1 D-amino acid dehydrogenase 1 [Alienimonas chondri]